MRAWLLASIVVTLCACKGTDGIVIGNSDGGVTDLAGSDGSVSAECAGAMGGQPCSTPGKSCSMCTDPCQFCNILMCQSGTWQALEVFPQQCNDAGMPLVCTPGMDQTCNQDPAMSSLLGHCNGFGQCECTFGEKSASTGKCVPSTCPSTAPTTGASCPTIGQSCSYPPNTACTCLSGIAGNLWSCAL